MDLVELGLITRIDIGAMVGDTLSSGIMVCIWGFQRTCRRRS